MYEEGCLYEETHCAPPCPSVVMIGFRSWPFRRFALPLLPLAACATAFALLMAAFLMSAPFIVVFPATRWPTVGGGVGRCGVRSGRVVDPRTPHRRRARVLSESDTASCSSRYACYACCRTVCDFFNCCEFVLALVSRAYPGTAPLIGGERVLQLCDGVGWDRREMRQSLSRHAGTMMDRV